MNHRLTKTLINQSMSTIICTLAITNISQAADLSVIGQTTIETIQDANTFPSIGAAVATIDEVIWQGVANCDSQYNTSYMACPESTMTVNSQVRIGSETKTYTGTIILQMVDEGKLALDNTLEQLVPELEIPNAAQITLEHVMNMTSTIPDYLAAPALPGFETELNPNPNIADQMAIQLGQTVATPVELIKASNGLPRTEGYNYSNTNYVILGYIAEKYSCADSSQQHCYSYHQLIESHIAAPLGLQDTYYPTEDSFNGPHAEGYVILVAGEPITGNLSLINPLGNSYETYFTNINTDTLFSAGGVVSNLPDQIKYVRQLTSNKDGLLTPQTQYQRLHDTVEVPGAPQNYGLGILNVRSWYNNDLMLGHIGATTGWSSALFENTTQGIYYAINANELFAYKEQSTTSGVTQITDMLMALDQNITWAIKADGNCNGDNAPLGVRCTGSNVRTLPLVIDSLPLVMESSGQHTVGYDTTKCQTQNKPYCPPVTYTVPALASFGHNIDGVLLTNANFILENEALLTVAGRNSAAIHFAAGSSTAVIAGTITAKGTNSYAITGGQSNDTVEILPTATINGPIDLGAGADVVHLAKGFRLSHKLHLDHQDTVKATLNNTQHEFKVADVDNDNAVDIQATKADGSTQVFNAIAQNSFTSGDLTVNSSHIIPADTNGDGIVDFIAWHDANSDTMIFQPTYADSPDPIENPITAPVISTRTSSSSIGLWLLILVPLLRFRRLKTSNNQ